MTARWRLIRGDNDDVLETFPENYFDSIVTDPPYHLKSRRRGARSNPNNNAPHGSRGLLGKQWDSGDVAFHPSRWRKAYRVLKPGAYMLVFGSPRTFHRLAVAIEDAGFLIIDTIMWLYSGFPKGHDVGKMMLRGKGQKTKEQQLQIKEWNGFKTQLKPAHEPILLVQKPLDGTVVNNVLKYGVGAMNIDACRIPLNEHYSPRLKRKQTGRVTFGNKTSGHAKAHTRPTYNPDGRYPPNIILDGSVAIDEALASSGAPVRFMYCAKASKGERGLDNSHIAVKPLKLMRYLCRLVTPPGGRICDPFAGSGTTVVAGLKEGFSVVGIELDEVYANEARLRIRNAVAAIQLT